MGHFFADSFQRRTGEPLAIVTGDARIAPLVALGAPSRPHVYFDWAPQRSPWANAARCREQGGDPGVAGADNAAARRRQTLQAQFPDLVPEVPRAFARAVQGRCRSCASAGR